MTCRYCRGEGYNPEIILEEENYFIDWTLCKRCDGEGRKWQTGERLGKLGRPCKLSFGDNKELAYKEFARLTTGLIPIIKEEKFLK